MIPRLLSIAVALVVACGTSGSDGDGGTLMRGDGGCFFPKEGAPCGSSDVSCIQGNPCCEGKWQCTNSKWTLLMFGCACQMGADAAVDSGFDAGPFACGGQMCSPAQYCEDRAPGIPDASDSLSCVSIPSACASTPTCTCVKANGACQPTMVTQCTEDAGHVTVHCLGQ
jgi:hypothetical protein